MWLMVLAHLALTSGLVPDPPQGQPFQPVDTVVLRSGGFLRGTISAYLPNERLTMILLGSGDLKDVPWTDVDHVERGDAPPEWPHSQADLPILERPPTLDLQLPPLGASLPPPRGIRIHVEADDPHVELFEVATGPAVVTRHHAFVATDRKICTAPCDAEVRGEPGRAYYFGGDGVLPSSQFQLKSSAAAVTAKVQVGHVASTGLGITLASLGGCFALGGLSPLIIGLSEPGPTSVGPNGALVHGSSGDPGLEILGGTLIAAGVAGLLWGIALMSDASDTRVELKESPSP